MKLQVSYHLNALLDFMMLCTLHTTEAYLIFGTSHWKTAALDNESQKLVQAALDELQATNPRTTLTVAHRLMTIKDCDKIAFLGDGGVLEMGKHSELLALKGNYYNLWIMQGSEEELEEKKKVV
jgi:ABC-type multidrug transport system ATPase subunit